MKKSESSLLFAFGVAAFCLWGMRQPDCDLGCQTVLEHILKHELKILL